LGLLAQYPAEAKTLKQAFGARQMAGLRAAFHVEPAEQAPQVNFDGVLTDLQLFGNVTVAQASVKHDQQLFLPLGELFRDGTGLAVWVLNQEDPKRIRDFSGTG
jgi:hypothetical protein